MLGSKKVPRVAMRRSSTLVTWLPCVTAKHPALAASRTAVLAWACTQLRFPRRRASVQAAVICARESVCPPPSRMLFDAKILITSAPRAACWRTHSRICAGLRLVSLNEPNDVRRRGPLTSPLAIATRRALSEGDPRLCTVV